ncbi:Arc family DNA-binding protein [Agrobacterium leguminum]
MPPAFRKRIEELASENRRSLNAEILYQLSQTIFDQLETKTAPHKA